MNIDYMTTITGRELSQTLDFMIKYYRQGIRTCKNDKHRKIWIKELDWILRKHKDLTTILHYEDEIFDVFDCNNKGKNIMTSELISKKINELHEQRRKKVMNLNGIKKK